MSALDLVRVAPDDGPPDVAAMIEALAVEMHARFDTLDGDVAALVDKLAPVVELVEQLAPIVEQAGPMLAQLDGVNPFQLVGMLMGRGQ